MKRFHVLEGYVVADCAIKETKREDKNVKTHIVTDVSVWSCGDLVIPISKDTLSITCVLLGMDGDKLSYLTHCVC